MPKKKTRDLFPWEVDRPVNAPQGVRVENNPEGQVEVSSLYLWMRFSEQGKKEQRKIDGKELYLWTKNPCSILLMGKLSFRLVLQDGRSMVMIEPRDHTEEFQFEILVGLWSLQEALYYFFN